MEIKLKNHTAPTNSVDPKLHSATSSVTLIKLFRIRSDYQLNKTTVFIWDKPSKPLSWLNGNITSTKGPNQNSFRIWTSLSTSPKYTIRLLKRTPEGTSSCSRNSTATRPQKQRCRHVDDALVLRSPIPRIPMAKLADVYEQLDRGGATSNSHVGLPAPARQWLQQWATRSSRRHHGSSDCKRIQTSLSISSHTACHVR